MKFRILKQTITFALIFQITFSQFLLLADQKDESSSHENPSSPLSSNEPGSGASDETSNGLSKSEDFGLDHKIKPFIDHVSNLPEDRIPEQSEAPRILDLDLLTKQGVRFLDASANTNSEATYTIKSEIPFNKPDISYQPTSVTSLPEVTYNSSNQELHLNITKVRHGFNKPVIQEQHFFKGIELTSNIVSTDLNFIFFATPEGLRAILVRDIFKRGFNSAILTPVVSGLPTNWIGDIKITKIEVLTKKLEPGVDVRDDEEFDAGDILVTLTSKDGSSRVETISRREIILNFRKNQLKNLVLVQLTDPDLTQQGVFQRVISENAESLGAYMRNVQSSANTIDNDGKTLQGTLLNISHNIKMKEEITLFNKHNRPFDDFEALAAEARDRFTGKVWKKSFAQYQESEEQKKQAEEAAKQESLFRKVSKNIGQAYQTYATPRRIAVLTAAMTGAAIDYSTGWQFGHWLLSTATHIMDWSSAVPIVRVFTEPLSNGLHYVTSTSWGLARVAAGFTIVAAFVPLSMMAAKLVATKQKQSWGYVQATFNYGLRLYAMLNYPLQKLLWDHLARQKMLYPALRKRVNPLSSWRSFARTFHLPFFGNKEKLQKKSEKLDEYIESESVRKSVAELIAAGIVSNDTGTDLASLLIMGQGERLERFANFGRDPELQARWTQVSQMAYKALGSLSPDQLLRLRNQNADDIEKLTAVYNKIAVRVNKEFNTNAGIFSKAATTVKWLGTKFTGLLKNQIGPYVLFGKQWMDLYLKYKDAEVDEQTTKICEEQYVVDYMFSAVYYAAADAEKFADLPVLQKHAPEIAFNQLDQVGLYTLTLPPEALTSAKEGNALKNPYKREALSLYDKAFVKTQSVSQGVSALFKSLWSKSNNLILEGMINQRKQLDLIIIGFQVYMLAGGLLRVGGLSINLAMEHGAESLLSLTTMFGIFSKAFAGQAYALFTKKAFIFAAIPIGYAAVWGYIQKAMRVLREVPDANKDRILIVVADIHHGQENENRAMMDNGINEMKLIYSENKVPLPANLDKATSEYTYEDARELLDFAQKNVPMPTEASGIISMYLLNALVGSALSTILFTYLSDLLYGDGFSPLNNLPQGIASFAASWLMLKGVTEAYSAYQERLRNRCNENLVAAKKE